MSSASQEEMPSGPASGARRARRRTQRGRSRRERVGLALFALTMTLPALAFGGQHTGVLVFAAVLAGASAVLLAHRVEQTPKLLFLVLGLLAFTALQLVPLPFGVVRSLSPAAADVWSGALRPFGEPAPAWVTLSIDPGATSLELLKGSIYACIVVAAAGAAAVGGGWFIPAVLFGASLLVALVTLAHGVVGADRVYGLFVAPSDERWIVGPFVNGNNLSGFLNVGLFAGAGLWLAESERVPRWVPAAGIPILAVSVVLSGSRGGVGALVLGAILFLALAFRRRDPRSVVLLGGTALVGVAGIIAVFAFGGTRLREQLTDADLFTKTALWRWTGPLIADFPVFGVGRGGYETSFPPYRQASEHEWGSVFTHAENFLLDWAAEWGVPVTAAAVLAAAWIARPVFGRLHRDPRAFGSWVGLSALLAQSVVDFGLEIFSIAALAVVVLATVPGALAAQARPRPWLTRLPLAASALAVVLAVVVGREPVQIERRKLARVVTELANASSERVAEARALLRSAMLRHPGEPYFPLLGSFVARHERKDPLPWLARALERGPRSGKVHLALAEVLRARGAIPQALMHLRLAARYDFNSRERALSLAGTWARSSRELILAFPEFSEGGRFLRDACGSLPEPAKLDCLREAVRRDPADRAARGALLELLLDAWEANVDPCGAGGAGACSEEVGRLVSALGEASDWRAANARGRLAALRGDVRRAARDLIEQCPAATEAEPCVARALIYAERAGDIGLIERASERYLALACVTPARCADAQFRIGKILSGRGASRVALKHFKQAVEADPSPRRWLDMADAAVLAGSSSTARLAIQRASSAGELTSDDRRRKDEIEERLSQPERLE